MSSVKPGMQTATDNRPSRMAQTPPDRDALRQDPERRDIASEPLWRRPDTMKGATFLAWQWPGPSFCRQ